MTPDPQPAPAVDPARCPLCGEDNTCGMAAGAGTCWCFASTVSPDALRRVPDAARQRACVCQRCAARGGSASA